MWRYLVGLLLVCDSIRSVASQDCPRAAKIRDGICATPCTPSTGCTQSNSDCLCDSQCGYSCVDKGLSCGPAPTVNNADLSSTGTSFNDTVVYKCRPGFTMNGDDVRRCTAKEKWSGVAPNCMRVCKQPDLPFGAYVKSNIKTEYNTGESITLDCKKGFKKIGTPSRFCISGRWTAFPFECKATHSCLRTIRASRTRCTAKCSPSDPAGCPAGHKCLCDGQCGYSCVEEGLQCPVPNPVKNGFVTYEKTGYNDTVRYRCGENYTLNGDRVRRCTAKKRWEGAVPSCLPDCDQPQVPRNAYIENKKSKYASGDRVTFKCDEGFNQEGIATTLCFMGDWNVMPFKCDTGGCGDPGTPDNGNKVGISYAHGREVFFSCNIGYVRVGSEQRRCLTNNTWSGTQPTCKLLDCGPPKELRNGTIIGNETTFQKSISFRCDEGFDLDRNPSAICQSDGKWSTEPKCEPLDCGNLDAPLHGSKRGSETTYTNKMEFSCDPGYKLIGSAVRYCLSSGLWDGVQPTCKALDCGVLEAPVNGSIQGDKWTYPNSVRFICDNGFDLIGSSVRSCQTDGTWGGQPVRCQAVDCGKLEKPRNGSLTGSQTTYPVTVVFQCDKGFLLKGSKYRKCQANRIWSGMLVYCQAVSCGKPKSVKNGVLSGKGITYPNIISYECDEGHLLNGPRQRQCQANGAWSRRDPTCDAISCGVLSAPVNGSKIGNVYTYPNNVTFSCDEGFDLIGSKSRVCLSNGSWSGNDTFCKGVDCGPLAVPINGSSRGSPTTFTSVITFECDRGFRLKGSASRRCQANKRWSGNLTTCEAVDCGRLKQPMNGSMFGSATVFPNKISFSCDVGFQMRGSQERKCQADRKWSGLTTRCEAVDCGSLAVPMNGSLQGQLTVFPNKIKFSCDVGFDLIGSSVRSCQSNGSWSGKLTKCRARYCGPLPRPRNGSSTGVLFVYPNKMTFNCDEGFDLRGSRTRKCLANGSWSGSTTSCHAVDCGPLQELRKGSSIGQRTTFPNKIAFSCERGYRLTGSRVRECQANRTWSGTMPTCGAVDCGYVPAPRNGSKTGDLTYFPNSVIFSCEKGFTLMGSKIRTCLANGSWSGSDAFCKAVDCGPLAVPTNGSMVGNNTVYPNEIKFSCDLGFVLRGSSVRKCLHFKMWSGYTAYCEAIDCGRLSAPSNGTIRGNLTVYPNTMKFICHRGFYLFGSAERKCFSNGTWSGTTAFCRAKDCGPLVVPTNGTMLGKKTVFPNIIRFKCDVGFELLGSPIRMCLASGKWNGIRARCRAVDCGVLPVPTNGSSYGNTTVFPNTVRLRCDEGFDLIGSATRTCMPDRKWNGSVTSCKAVDCGPLVVPQNGSKHGSMTVFPNTITFSCDEGFLLRGSSSRVCQANRTWSGSLTRCEAIDCGPMAVPTNGSIHGNRTVYPNSIRFKCDEGFDLLGSAVRTCSSNGKWDGIRSLCQAVNCGPLAVPRNGSKHGSMTVFPNTIAFSCDEGFLLRGSSSRVCQANRTWSGSLTRCEAIDCGPLSSPMNGSMYGRRTVFPNSITFKCDQGFDLIGSTLRTCLSSGKWDGNKTTCRAVDCGPLAVPQNGSRHGSSTVFPNVITFSCDEGFLLRGSSSRVCQANRTWSGSLTRCEAVDCGPLFAPMNGSLYGNKTFFPNIITFECDVGFDLNGSSMRACLSNGKWSGNITSCKAVNCGPLTVPQNGSRHGSSTVFPNVLTFSCDEGFLLRGSSSRVCQANRTWSGSSTRCEAVDCGQLAVPTNGSMYGNKTVFPNSIKFKCKEGFDLFGSSVRLCLSNGKWSGNQTICTAVDCGSLVVPQNGSKYGSITAFPVTITFSCDEGFLLRGSSSRVCQANRTWSGSLTRCEAIDCGPLSSPMNGSMYGRRTVFPNSITFKCNQGFDLIGSTLRTCLSSGKWDGNKTTCRAVDCGSLAVPQNGSRHGSSTVFPNVITFSCDEGFLLRGSSSRVCQANRTWSGSLTRCEAINCGPLGAPINGSVQGSNTVFPNFLEFICDEGFDIIGPSRRSCLPNGNWSGTLTTCKAVDCGSLAIPQNGSRHGSSTVFPNVLTFSCDEGFLLRGSSSRVCQANRTWSGSLTRCEAKDCGFLPAPMNGSISGNQTVFPNSKTFQCDVGFNLIGSSIRTCSSNGNWSGTQPLCKAVDCGPLAVPQNGSRHGSSTVFPNVLTFSCDEGFLLRGSSSRVCQANRTWSGSLTRCEAVDCGSLAVPVNGSMYGNKTTFPNSLRFGCDEGFDLLGSSVRTCMPTGKWNGNTTLCRAVNCGPLVVPQNGSKHGSLTVFPNVITFSCDEGFLLRGSSSRVCQANRTWSGSLTQCEAVDCGPLFAPMNGSLYGNKTFFPNIITFECDVGFDLNGSSMRACLSNGKWSGNITSCKAVNCGPLTVPQNGSRHGSSTVFPNVLTFSCNEGFLLRGSSSRVCQANRTWSGSSTRCEAVDCGSLAVPVNGSMYGNKTTFPNSLRFGCDEGFDLLGSSVRTCMPTGKWNGNTTLCRAVNCGPLAVPQNGSRHGSSTVFPNVITFSCDEGFLLRGSSSRVCQANRTWSGSLTRCEAVDCGPLFAPMNGSLYGNKTFFPNIITFECDVGFDLNGSSMRACLSNGKWSGNITSCKAVNCGPLTVPQNGSRHGSSTVFPNVLTFSCNEGFLLRGSSSRVCQANRTWSGSSTRCEAVDCGSLAVPVNGSMYGNKTTFPNSLRFGCDEGFDLLGSSVRTCLPTGKWNGNTTLCRAVNCGPLAVPQNGSRHGSSTVFPNVITFSCDEGFLLRGSSSRVCQANRIWSGSLTLCEAVDCGPLFAPMNGSLYGNKTFFPNIITFGCDVGFDLNGSSMRACLSNGKWSGNITSCKAVNCGPLTVPQNGSRHGSSTVFPNVLTFSCDEGFLLRGSSSRVCQANRTWSGSLTRCEAVDCGSLAVPVNGSMYGNKTTFPNSLRFGCDEGFDLLGSSVRTCMPTGKWNGNTTLCRAVNCGPLAVPQNGSRHGSSTVFPNVITFSCDEGFLLRGSSSRVCQANRTWSGSLTRCEAVDCGPLFAPMNGSLYGNKTFFPNIITFECDVGFDLNGSSMRACLSNGKWSGNITSCKAVNCGPLTVPQNGSRHGSSTVFPNVLTFSCDEGFLLRGSSSRVCQANRTWSGSLTRCEAVDCGSLAVPVNGSMYGNKTTFPNSLRFGCDEGFDLLGSSVRTCMPTGKWNGNTTLCRAVNCGPLAVPQNGSRHGSSTVFPNVITFSCDEGFLLRGSSSRVCQANRTWSGSLTRCEAVDCGPLFAPMNGSLYGNKTFFPNIITFECDVGFDLNGSSMRACLSNGKWSGNITSCKAVNCGPLTVPQNGSRHGSSTVFPNVLTFSCDEGFLLRGSSSRVCQANRTWSGSSTRCEAVDCGPLAAPMNGTMQGTKTVFPNILSFTCDEGFDLLDSSKRTCLSNGNWSGTHPSCQAVDCGPLPVPQNGSKHGSLTVFPNTITFSCDEGFLLRGSSSRVCQANRTWSGSLTRCEAVDCGPLFAPMNGSLYGNKTFFPNIITFECDVGFDLNGSSMRACLSNGKWSGNITSCKAIDCGSLDAPTNGSLHGELTVFPNKIRFTCDKGFDHLGPAMRSCLSNGTWSGSRASCKAVDCGSLAVPMNGSTSGFLTTYPNQISFACDKGFILIGSSVRTCLSNRNWSGTTTRCQAIDCGPLVVPMNGTSKGSLTVFPNVITFGCDIGFILSGSSRRQCQADGAWSGTNTICNVINCGSLLEPRNGFACGERTVFPYSVYFHCDTGYVLVGSPVRRCQANGVWSGTTTYCRAVDCGSLGTPMNGTRKGNQTIFPSVVQFACNVGFMLQGSSDRICQANGMWSGVPATCNAVDCGSLAVPMNGSLQGQLTVFPNKIKFSCDVGFDLIGSSVRSCQSNRLWSGQVTTCQAVDCGPVNDLDNGRVAATGTTFTQTAVYTCYDGFILKGNSVRVCQASRTWSGKQPHCNAVDCGKLEAPANGAMRGQLTVFPNKVTFTCNDGFDLIGSPELQCLASGRWSNSTPTCKAVRCSKPVIPPNSYLTTQLQPYFDNKAVIYFSCRPRFFLRGTPIKTCWNGNWTKTEFLCLPPKCSSPQVPNKAYITFPRGKRGPYVENDKVYFSCKDGYYLKGNPFITCKGKWTDYRFTCQAVECGSLPPPQLGHIERFTGTTFGQQYEFGCDWENGFKLEGSQVRVCQSNKQWSGKQPFCQIINCGQPKTPDHGIKLDFNYTFNNVVRFRCDQGYSPRGFRETRCQINSRWSGTGLICLSCSGPLGMSSRIIPRKSLSASSERDPKHSADHGRLLHNSAWCSARSKYEKYLQVDFGSRMEVTAIATQGHPKEYKWIHEYHLKYALGAHWFEYRVNGKIKVFKGNRDHNTIVKRHLEKSIIAHNLRLYRHENTETFSGSSVCLRMEVYGCKFYTKCLTFGTRVLARWYHWREQTTYIMGYVSAINKRTIGITPRDQHSSLTPGTVLMVRRSDPYYILQDVIPLGLEITNRIPVVTLLRGQDGTAVYSSGKVVNKVESWYQVNLDNDEIAHWRRLTDIRLMRMPENCESQTDELEIMK